MSRHFYHLNYLIRELDSRHTEIAKNLTPYVRCSIPFLHKLKLPILRSLNLGKHNFFDGYTLLFQCLEEIGYFIKSERHYHLLLCFECIGKIQNDTLGSAGLVCWVVFHIKEFCKNHFGKPGKSTTTQLGCWWFASGTSAIVSYIVLRQPNLKSARNCVGAKDKPRFV